MSVVDGGPSTAGIVARVQGILLKPQEEWAKIDAEPATTQSLLTYAAILSVIGAVASLLVGVLFTHNVIAGVLGAVLGLVFSVAVTWVVGFIISALASSFGSQPDPIGGLKTAVYANTAYWVACIANIIPVVGLLVVIAGFAYTCYLLYLGLKAVMKAPDDKAVVYTIVTVLANLVVVVVAAMVTGMIVAMVAVGGAVAAGGAGMLR